MYLRLADQRGWVFEANDKWGVLCHRLPPVRATPERVEGPESFYTYSGRPAEEKAGDKVDQTRQKKLKKVSVKELRKELARPAEIAPRRLLRDPRRQRP